MKTIRKSGENLEQMLKELQIGDIPVYDMVSNYEITKVPGGFIYKSEYAGMVFVPDVEKGKKEPVANIQGSVAKVGRPPKVEK